jgi:hypothetical protein
MIDDIGLEGYIMDKLGLYGSEWFLLSVIGDVFADT